MQVVQNVAQFVASFIW